MSTVIEHGVVVPKPTVKAVACCIESLKVMGGCVYTLVITGYTLGSGSTCAALNNKSSLSVAHSTNIRMLEVVLMVTTTVALYCLLPA